MGVKKEELKNDAQDLDIVLNQEDDVKVKQIIEKDLTC